MKLRGGSQIHLHFFLLWQCLVIQVNVEFQHVLFVKQNLCRNEYNLLINLVYYTLYNALIIHYIWSINNFDIVTFWSSYYNSFCVLFWVVIAIASCNYKYAIHYCVLICVVTARVNLVNSKSVATIARSWYVVVYQYMINMLVVCYKVPNLVSLWKHLNIQKSGF